MSAFPTNPTQRSQFNPRLLASGLLTATDTALYTCPSDRRCAITAIVFCSVSATAATFRLHHVVPWNTSTTGNAQYYDSRLNANAVLIDQTPRWLDSGDELRGRSTAANTASFAIYGYESGA
jgi:hypothetical protein